MILKVCDARAQGDGGNVWVEDCPLDFLDADVKHSVEQWAKDGDKVAQLALELVDGKSWIWLDLCARHIDGKRVHDSHRVYRDDH